MDMSFIEYVWLLPVLFIGLLVLNGVRDGYREMSGTASPDRAQPFMPKLLALGD